MLSVMVRRNRKKIGMNNRRVPMRSVSSMRMCIRRMKMESGEKQKNREKKNTNPRTPG